MTKVFLVAVIIISLFALVGCISTTAVVGESKTYDITSDISSLDIKISAADFVIVHGDEFSVESNLKNLNVSEQDGVLSIVEKTRHAKSYNGAKLKLCIPENVVIDNVNIATGAGRLTADSMSANTMTLKTGAGMVEFGSLTVNNNIKIAGGAGHIGILDGTLNNLSLDLGVGELDMTAQLLGESDLRFGVGESSLTLIGSEDDYSFDVKHGIGQITIDNNSAMNYVSSTNGENHINIKGGIGAIDISFKN